MRINGQTNWISGNSQLETNIPVQRRWKKKINNKLTRLENVTPLTLTNILKINTLSIFRIDTLSIYSSILKLPLCEKCCCPSIWQVLIV